ncbi:MAG: carbamoyltransferase HypF [Planctomycetes bacterium HGW-Planctomycetes-1]|nr:MAG: carbamoyltransferase HypF [Planctomycetes bacterium HGW-Planctomycetes-1]
MRKIRKKITVQGQVQGIGFRPFVYTLAAELNLTGFVYNYTQGVIIEIQGQKTSVEKFIVQLKNAHKEKPLLKITALDFTDIELVSGEKTFEIKQSESDGIVSAEVTADIATCKDCFAEMFDKNDFRYHYPFINCTNCGPRYSIIKSIPYDRPNTTMSVFSMCGKCSRQYENAEDRRFHAQPVACPVCGPKIKLCDNKGKEIETDSDKVISETVRLLREGKIVAIKGLGGFHLACDAENEQAVKTLRSRKMRDAKPFAMMAADIEKIRQFAVVDKKAEEILRSIEAPIVLLPKKEPNTIAPSAAEGVNTFGFMLPYTPLHHLIFSEGKLNALIMTSGNISDEPLICKDDEALEKLGSIAEAFLMHDRVIYRQVDDSIIHIIKNEPVLLRRSRGFVPQAFVSKSSAWADIFAVGADLKNTFCFVKKNRYIVSEHIGDMADASVYKHWLNSIGHLKKLLEAEPFIIACDMHPGYLSSQYARKLKKDRLIEVQHHWAHIASVLAEHNRDEKVIGLVADGTGYGTDGTIWGCECLIASLDDFQRFGHLSYYPLAGGDSAATEAIRPVIGLMKKYELSIPGSILDEIEPDREKRIAAAEQIEKNINTIKTSSLGRLFDAVSALCGLGSRNNFEAQLPMALEAIADKRTTECYPFELKNEKGTAMVEIGDMLKAIAADRIGKVDKTVISAKFHNTVAAFFLSLAKRARDKTGINTAAISGGVFCNRFLSGRLIELLQNDGFEVLFNRYVPANDGGISLGQAAIAAKITGKG